MIVRLALRSLAVRPMTDGRAGVRLRSRDRRDGGAARRRRRDPRAGAIAGACRAAATWSCPGAFGSLDNAPFVLSSRPRRIRRRGGVAVARERRVVSHRPRRARFPWWRAAACRASRRRSATGKSQASRPGSTRPATRGGRHVDRRRPCCASLDRFHRPPDVPEFASSWAEWLYFNGRTPDGRVRFYLTFIVGPSVQSG